MGYTSSEIAFPGLGIDKFVIDRTAFTIFGRDIAWYALIITFGMIVAVGYVIYRSKQYKGITTDDILDYAIYMILFGILGARLYYVIFYETEYTFIEFFQIWNGGLAIYGGIIAGGLAALVVSLIKGIRPQCFFDMVAPGVMIAQAIGRWGNFFNGECFGGPTALPWGMELSHLSANGNVVESFGMVEPTFLYESLWNVLGFILINLLYKKRKFDGQSFLTYVAWYGLGRGYIEGLRTDSLTSGDIRVSQLLGYVSCAVAVVALVVFLFLVKAPRYESAATEKRELKLAALEEEKIKKEEYKNKFDGRGNYEDMSDETENDIEKGENENGSNDN